MASTKSNDLALTFNFQPKQALAFNTPNCEMLFGGAAGGGKSWFIRASSILYALECPGIQIYVIRRELKSLLQSMMSSSEGYPAMLQELIEQKLVKINNQDHVIQFKNGGKNRNSFASGSAIRLVHMGNDAAIEAVTGSELHMTYIDEAASLPPEYIQHILTRVRLGSWAPPANSRFMGMFPKVVYATNPSGPSRLWLKKRFVDSLDPYKLSPPEDSTGLDKIFIKSLVLDNPALLEADPGYIDRLKSLDNKDKRDMYLYGKWDVDLNGIFAESFNREFNILPEFTIPRETTIYRAYDHGVVSPWGVLYYIEIIDEDLNINDNRYSFPRGTIILVGEILGAEEDNPDVGLGLTDFEIGRMIKNHEAVNFPGRRIKQGPADNATYTTDNNKHCPMDDIIKGYFGKSRYDKNALFTPFLKPKHSRVNGYSRMRTMFKATHGYNTGKYMEQEGLFTRGTLRWWMRGVPNAPSDPRNPEDVPRGYRDELLDITRYIVLSKTQKLQQIKTNM